MFVLAAAGPDSLYPRIVPVPPSTDNPSADCLSIVFDGEFELFVSPHILSNVRRILERSGWAVKDVDAYLELIVDVVEASNGKVIEPARSAFSSEDFEDNLILDLVAASGADLLVTDDTDLTPLSPWRGVPIVRPHHFVDLVVHQRRKSGL